MEIHKPKPWHGWREFLKEYLIVVVGVLTALAAESGVEWLHWQHVTEQQREALNLNAADVRLAMLMRGDIEPCVAAKLDQADEVLRRHDKGLPLGVIGPVGRPQYLLAKFTAWHLALADQSISHMPMKEKASYLSLAGTIQNYEGTRLDERAAWRDLQILDDADRLSASEWADVRRSVKLARDIDRNMRQSLNEGDWLYPFKAFHLPDLGKRAAWTDSPFIQRLCAPMIAPVGAKAG
jgi:hypothetical protein